MNVQGKPSKLLKGATGDWEVVIGLEVHAQVTSQAKLFSGASTAFGGEPNSHVSLVDAAMPGMLPVINEACVMQAVRTGLGLKAKINLSSVFDRKNYFYPDLPQGYQISQYKSPVVGEGEVVVDMPDGESIKVGIERLHLEQDAGKSMHDRHPTMSFVDLNRSGVALMEIVSKPDLRSARRRKPMWRSCAPSCAISAPATATWRRAACAPTSTSRCAGRRGRSAPVARSRTSIPSASSARPIDYEARRQIEIIEDGGQIDQETRLFDPNRGETRSMRSKEEAHDYRYFPDPDLLPLELAPDFVEALKAAIAGAAGRKEGALHARLRAFGLRRQRPGRRTGRRRVLRAGRGRPRRQGRGQLGDQRARRPAEQGRQGHSSRRRSRPRSLAPFSI